MSTADPVALVDLALRGHELDDALAALRRVMERGWFVLGPEVRAFEEELAAASGLRHAVGVASGTDALILGLRALGIGAGDEVIVPQMTAFPTAAAVVEAGATPVLVDIAPGRPHLDLSKTVAALTPRTRAVILVHLYGACADAVAFADALRSRGVELIEDCAQAQGALLPTGAPVGTVGRFAAFSFYPTKNLGALGDGGAFLTDDESLAEEVTAWRSHGERAVRYRHELPARNSRLDDLHAAVLRLRLTALPDMIAARRALSSAYHRRLGASVSYVDHGPGGAPHLAVVTFEDRQSLADHLSANGIATGVHYPLALGDQPALLHRAVQNGAPVAREWAARCLSLPLHLGMDESTVDRVASVVLDTLDSAASR